ncbi:4-hydroxythreonine-4-phosphate dehydrogenase [Ancylomarina sp. 16SWW S1-10-2]|uniref:4-hydroxythreonine-4-phosphate dehydrogenase n=1 Tax=Ancylomarina sp. 16SWW S1-10-2 TaxID=2499681 RepID=UPI0012AD6DAC|nr:4-hydroxythreonine-4-phosphate dehydrogenase [Ancylomarina sp. 16SWW S1-10-2]MRT91759.1 4-hydroxythreonine-4-phosphate dehydrogenase [Ancylomarina sp. 16SWW S1-10-2]
MSTRSIDFIFMLTKDDQTVTDARAYIKEIASEGVKHMGFKDIGLPLNELKEITKDLRNEGVKVYLEVVSLDAESEKRSAKIAIDLNVDYLLGGTRPELIAPIVKDHKLKYYPFVGQIESHPSILKGTITEIANHAQQISAIDGVDGLDLLAYRFTGKDVPLLIREVCKKSTKPVIVAGSIDSKERIEVVKTTGASGFTVGTAAFGMKFPSIKAGIAGQVQSILEMNA